MIWHNRKSLSGNSDAGFMKRGGEFRLSQSGTLFPRAVWRYIGLGLHHGRGAKSNILSLFLFSRICSAMSTSRGCSSCLLLG